MKSKTEFYQAFFETLEKKGFSIRPPSSPDYVADIYHKNRQIAFYGRQAVHKNRTVFSGRRHKVLIHLVRLQKR